ncbi:hypothetical protein NDU88_003020 [Pleurodeles waltl]|uniref:Uncharacterized protein n=1 Tax=Pleurodeles waltl TaxID=8319 RepID=A0AAV7MPD8_PLEWA|nr:hypothetical protein NDU88_003020 [Pleurodeles waltl]
MRRNKTARTPSHPLDSRATPTEGRNRSGSGDCIPPTNPSPPTGKLDLIVQEIHESRAAIEHCMDSIAADLSILKADHKKLADKVRAAEGTVTKLAPQYTRNTNIIFDL